MDRHRRLVQLLNYALQRDVTDNCAWHGGRKIIYFRPYPDPKKTRQLRGASGRPFEVVKPKFKKSKPGEISYHKHAALTWQFLLLDDQWVCALTPTFHYTRDGYRDSRFLAEYLTGIKRRDRNPAVYGQTRMWATYLHGEDGVLDPHETILTYGELMTFTADRAIDDAAWLADPRKDESDATAEIDKPSPDDELALFEVEL